MDIDWKKTLLCFVEPFNGIEAGCFRKFAVQPIAPTVVLATEDTGCTTLRLYDRECSVSTNIVEAVNLAFAVLDQEKRVSGYVEFLKVAGLDESESVGEKHPISREYRSSLKLIEALRPIP